MSEDNIDLVVAALLKVPEKKLLIIQLVNEIPVIDGVFDYHELSGRQLEINLAIQEAKVYGSHTIQAVDSLVRLRGKEV
ncbi:MAG: hypothetical protein PHD09_07125 [Candidatus Omnitrophica bacterium]|jgi:hypothetical protein|nr:hypothetical protein [Candidatus Omnitrophota bacterium]